VPQSGPTVTGKPNLPIYRAQSHFWWSVFMSGNPSHGDRQMPAKENMFTVEIEQKALSAWWNIPPSFGNQGRQALPLNGTHRPPNPLEKEPLHEKEKAPPRGIPFSRFFHPNYFVSPAGLPKYPTWPLQTRSRESIGASVPTPAGTSLLQHSPGRPNVFCGPHSPPCGGRGFRPGFCTSIPWNENQYTVDPPSDQLANRCTPLFPK